MSFEAEMRRGRFAIPRCERCAKIVWPYADFCDSCMGEVRVTAAGGPVRGRVIEFSRRGKHYFCLVEIRGAIRIMAGIPERPAIGQTVTVVDCGVADDNNDNNDNNDNDDDDNNNNNSTGHRDNGCRDRGKAGGYFFHVR